MPQFYSSTVYQGACSPIQVGAAAEWRFKIGSGLTQDERYKLNAIIHSPDRYMRNGTANPYFDPTKQYDPNAQQFLDKMKKRSFLITKKIFFLQN